MNAVPPAAPDHPALLIEAVADRLRGCIGILMLLRNRAGNIDAYYQRGAGGALGEQIDTLRST